MYEVTFPVRYYEADPMGVVHHSEYVRYFEIARNTWLHDVGYTSEACALERLVFPVVHLECDYKHPARFGENVTSKAEIISFTGARVGFHQQVIDSDGNLCAEGKVVLGFMDSVTGHIRRCPERLAEIIENQLKQK